MDVLKPKRLVEGDVIGVVAPAHPLPLDETSNYFKNYLLGKYELEQMGFVVLEGENMRKREWWRAGTPKERADDINGMLVNDKVKAVIAHDGGNDCLPVLEHLDYGLVMNNPKPFIGFSNITNLHLAFYTKTRLIGFHMGLLTYELGGFWQEASLVQKQLGREYFYKILTSTQPLGVIQPLTSWETWKSGLAEGALFGGNLSMIDSLLGTEYFPKVEDLRGNIFFWELDNSPSYRIERVLTHLKYIGLFDVISGMLVGKLVDVSGSVTSDLVEPSYKEIVTTVLKEFNFPILGGVDFGHKMVQIPMPIGLRAKIDADSKRLEFLDAVVV